MRKLIMSWTERSVGRVVLGSVLLLLVAARSAHAFTVTVTWDAPEDPTVVGYVISYGTSSGSYSSEIPVGNVVSWNVDGLNDTGTYYFMVQSLNSAGMRSEPSAEVMYASFAITCRVTNAVSPDGNPVAVTLESPIIVGGVPPPQSADCAPASGSLFPVGNTPVTCTATDATRSVSCQSVVSVTYQSGNSFTVTGSPKLQGPGGPLTVQWTAPAQNSATDWIGLYRMQDGNTDYIWWAYTNGESSGSFNLPAPTNPGAYQFRYLQDDGYLDAARSNTIMVSAPKETLVASPATLSAGQRLTVQWTGSAGGAAHDWIGLYPVGAANTDFIWWIYTNGTADGTATIRARLGWHGAYEFRYLLDDGYTDTARSNTVTIR